MVKHAFVISTVIGSLLLESLVVAQQSRGQIDELLVLDNESVRVAVITFHPGSASGQHVNIGPELGIILEGELTLITPRGQEILGPGTAHWLSTLTPHDARNEGGRLVKLIALLLKRCD